MIIMTTKTAPPTPDELEAQARLQRQAAELAEAEARQLRAAVTQARESREAEYWARVVAEGRQNQIKADIEAAHDRFALAVTDGHPDVLAAWVEYLRIRAAGLAAHQMISGQGQRLALSVRRGLRLACHPWAQETFGSFPECLARVTARITVQAAEAARRELSAGADEAGDSGETDALARKHIAPDAAVVARFVRRDGTGQDGFNLVGGAMLHHDSRGHFVVRDEQLAEQLRGERVLAEVDEDGVFIEGAKLPPQIATPPRPVPVYAPRRTPR